MTQFRLMLAAGALSLAASAAWAQQSPAAQATPDQPTTAQPAPAQATPDQPTTMGAPAQNQPAAPGQDMSAPAQNQPAPPAAASATAAGTNTSAQVVTPGSAPSTQVQALAGGDNVTVTNGPIPDTAANRAKYGAPMSMTGRRSRPAGN